MNLYALPRNQDWRFELLDREDRPLGLLDGVAGGGTEVAALSRLGGSGSILIDDVGRDIDWMSNRLRVIYDPGVKGLEPWPVATMLFTTPRDKHSRFGRSFDVKLLSKMTVLDEDALSAMASYPSGTPIIPAVVDLIHSAGESRIAVTDNGVTLASPLTFDAGTQKLTAVNELLETAGYRSLWCDRLGQFRVEPYVDPNSRPEACVFASGEASIVAPEWDSEQDLTSVPNRFIVVGEGSGDQPPLVGVSEPLPPESPFSYESRGRWITRTEEGVEGANQAVFDQLANRRLAALLSPVSRIEFEHAVMPLDPQDRVGFRPDGAPAMSATVMKLSYKFTHEADCQSEGRLI